MSRAAEELTIRIKKIVAQMKLKYLRETKVKVKHAQALEQFAQLMGYKNWNTLIGLVQQDPNRITNELNKLMEKEPNV